MTEFGKTNPSFASEIEFQAEFTVWLRSHLPELGVELERRVYPNSLDELDMALKGLKTAIELKFATTPTSPADVIRYGFIKDICRLETLCATPDWDEGYAILLTNRDVLWKKAPSTNVTDVQFHVHEGKEIHGELAWTNNTAKKTKSKHPPLNVQGYYEMRWNLFGDGGFKYLLVAVH